MEDTVTMEHYHAMLDAMHEVCESYKQQRDDARKESAMYKEWWLTSAANETKLTDELNKAIEYTHDLEDENMALNNQITDDDEDMYEDLGTEIIGGPESTDEPMTTHSDIIDAMLSSITKSMANSTIKDEP